MFSQFALAAPGLHLDKPFTRLLLGGTVSIFVSLTQE